jgi:chromate transporter
MIEPGSRPSDVRADGSGAPTAGPAAEDPAAEDRPVGRVPLGTLFMVFLRLGLTSFGGPVAHLGYFRTEFVERRRWMDDRSYADLVALCQFLPGPASSQVGMAIGLARGGWLGSLAAWAGFTLPSALLLIAFALGVAAQPGWLDSGLLQGLKVAAVAVVAQAVWGMSRTLCPDRPRAGLALAAALALLALPTVWAQVAVMVACGVAGWVLLKLPGQAPVAHSGFGVSRRAGAVALGVLALLLLGLPLLAASGPLWAIADAMVRAGALVFGGGHVVLPLLQASVVQVGAVQDGMVHGAAAQAAFTGIDNTTFLAGYGAAQAVPGPLFTFAAYLGAMLPAQGSGALAWPGGWGGGLIALVAIFVPAWLLVVGALPFWDRLRQRPALQSALAGVNAGVVGLLLAALYDPVWTGAIHTRADFALGLAAFALLVVAKWSPLAVVALAAAGGWALRALG